MSTVVDKDDGGTDWASFFGSVDESDTDYVQLTPETIAVLSLKDSFDQLQQSAQVPNKLALAAKSAHLALQSALIAALAGTANIGAHPPKLRAQYLSYLNNRHQQRTDRPASDRVMSFPELLETATSSPLEWSSSPLIIGEEERELINRLTDIRHDVEHPKQMLHAIEPSYIKQTLPVAVRLTVQLLEQVFHHLEPGELEEIKQLQEKFSALCEGDT